jgi:hypothetical protein
MNAADVGFDADHYRRNQERSFVVEYARTARFAPKKDGGSMYRNMMQTPLPISALLRHADSHHGNTEIVSGSTRRDASVRTAAGS